MQKLRWVIFGTVLGFVAAHFVNRSPEGRRFFERVNRGLDEFGQAFATGYRDEEAEAFAAASPNDLDANDLDDIEAQLRKLPNKR